MKSNRAVLWGTLVLCLASGIRSAAAEVETAFVKQSRFGVPFEIDPAEIARLRAREVRLFASLDRGATWQHVSSQSPDADRFVFEAPRDGEYWFAIRTLDARNRLHPPTTTVEPGLKVVVDRTAPDLKLSLDQVSPGMIRLTWSATDANLQADSLVLESIQTGTDRWRPLNVKPTAAGQIAWAVAPGARVAVRGRIADRAQNEAQQQVQVGPTVEVLPPPSLADAQPSAPPGAEPSQRIPDSFAAVRRPQLPQNSGPDNTRDVRPAFESGHRDPEAPSEPLIRSRSTTGPQVMPAGAADDDAAQAGLDPPQDADTPPDLPEVLRQVVNTRKFRIQYAVDDVDPSGIAGVEIYVTEDDGRQWWRYGQDEDRTSPAEIEVPREGAYGFALRIQSAMGLAAEPPRPSEKPEFIIVVDETPPTAELLPIQPEMTPGQLRVPIRWKVEDEHPDRTPVALSYAANSQGPWQPICNWQEDGGEYVWNVGREVPARVFIRLSARDAAGNVTHVQTPAPIVMSRSIPRARVVGVEPIGVRR